MTSTPSHIMTTAQQPFEPKFVAGKSEEAHQMMMRQKEIFRAKLENNNEDQLAWQNAQPIYSAIRLNGKLVGTMGLNTGLTMTEISDGGAYQRAVTFAEKTGMNEEEFNAYATDQVSQALKGRYGDSIEIEVFAPDERPQSGEMHAEMFGTSASDSASGSLSDNELSYMEFFAQLYSQQFGEDPFDGLDMT